MKLIEDKLSEVLPEYWEAQTRIKDTGHSYSFYTFYHYTGLHGIDIAKHLTFLKVSLFEAYQG